MWTTCSWMQRNVRDCFHSPCKTCTSCTITVQSNNNSRLSVPCLDLRCPPPTTDQATKGCAFAQLPSTKVHGHREAVRCHRVHHGVAQGYFSTVIPAPLSLLHVFLDFLLVPQLGCCGRLLACSTSPMTYVHPFQKFYRLHLSLARLLWRCRAPHACIKTSR